MEGDRVSNSLMKDDLEVLKQKKDMTQESVVRKVVGITLQKSSAASMQVILHQHEGEQGFHAFKFSKILEPHYVLWFCRH